MDKMTKARERAEIACGLLWFILDGCWLLEWRAACYIACVFAVVAGLAVLFFTERRVLPLWVCAADSMWLSFNILWAVGDLAHDDFNIAVAKVLFFLGGITYLTAFLIADDTRQLVLRPLRFLSALVRPK